MDVGVDLGMPGGFGTIGGLLDPAGLTTGTGLAGGEYGETAQMFADPMDLFGIRADQTQSQVSDILTSSAAAGIESQEAMRQQMLQMYEPYYQSAVSEALPQLQAMATGGEIDYTPSALYDYQKETGERNIRRIQASKGQLESSATAEYTSDLNLGLAQEEMDRLYAGQLSRVQLGTGAADAISAASQSLGGNISGLYTGLGGALSSAQQSYGEARQSAFQGLSSTMMGLGQYMHVA